MTHHEENTAIGQMLEAVIENGIEGLEAAISILLGYWLLSPGKEPKLGADTPTATSCGV